MTKILKKHAAILIALALGAPLSAAAQTTDKNLSGGIGLSFGYNSNYKRTLLSYETESLFSHHFDGGSKLGLHIELGAAHWKSRKSKSPKSMSQFSAIPVVRWWPSEQLYLDIGSGPTLMTRSRFAGKNISTKFQFGSRVGVGYLTHGGHQFGLRYSHFSNAGIKTPNPGLDLLELEYRYRF